MNIESRDPKTLRNHPLNITLYGSVPETQFVDSVRKFGIITPLQVLPDGTIIEGHRRRQAAIMANVAAVPVVVRTDLTDPLEVEQALILGNKYRDKTTELKAREFRELERIEGELAIQRSRANLVTANPSPEVPNLAPREISGKNKHSALSSTKAAEAVGMKRSTAVKAAAVVEAIDAAEQDGDAATAAKLRDTLNNRSVSAAVAMTSPRSAKNTADEFRQRVSLAWKAYNVLGGHINWMSANARKADLKEAIKEIDNALTGDIFPWLEILKQRT